MDIIYKWIKNAYGIYILLNNLSHQTTIVWASYRGLALLVVGGRECKAFFVVDKIRHIFI